MLSAIREIGKWQINKIGKKDLDVLIKEPNFKDGGKIVFIKIDIDKGILDGVELADYDSSKSHKYLFRGGVSQGPNPTPIANIINAKKGKDEAETNNNLEKQLVKTFDGKILKWFDKYSVSKTLSKEEKGFLEKIKNILSKNKEQIIRNIQSLTKDISKKKGKLLTVKIKDNDKWFYIGDFEIFKNLLQATESEKITGISTNNKICSICAQQKSLVSGDVSVFKFYTIDKPGFITGGFVESLAWKNFPVCPECKLGLEEGRRFVDSNLNFKFYGLNYSLIPRLLMGNENMLDEIIGILSDTTKISLKERVKKRIMNNEDDILEYFSEKKDILTLDFLFLQKKQSAERILLLIEDVFPSRIRKIFKAKEYVENVFNEDFNFGKIRTFFSKSDAGKRESDLNKYFLEIVDSVFKGKKLDSSFLTKFFMSVIRGEFVNDGYFSFRVKDALMNILFFKNLGLITFEEENMEESLFKNVFCKYGNSFITPVKRGIFLLGSLTQLLLNKQWSDRSAKPFIKKLKSLKMDEKDIKGLLPQVQNKLEEYDSFDKGKRIIASEASKYLLEAGNNWKMSVDEINFYFACGMNLVDEMANIVYPKMEEKKEEK
ncbi:MAG: TIGR02556 family CRISPR-associated protein [bacterium]